MSPVTWVVGDTAEVMLHVRNTLGVDVKISRVSLVCEGPAAAGLELEPATALLEAYDGSGREEQAVIVRAVPRLVGSLQILGYTHTVLGVESTCLLSSLPTLSGDVLKVSNGNVEPEFWIRIRVFYDNLIRI